MPDFEKLKTIFLTLLCGSAVIACGIGASHAYANDKMVWLVLLIILGVVNAFNFITNLKEWKHGKVTHEHPTDTGSSD